MKRSPRTTHVERGRSSRPKSREEAIERERARNKRILAAKAEAAQAEAQLEARIAREAEQPAVGETPGAAYARERREQEEREAAERAQQERLASVARAQRREIDPDNPLGFQWDGDGIDGWTPANARRMLRQGYNVRQVIKLTGVGYKHLNIVRLDANGFGLED